MNIKTPRIFELSKFCSEYQNVEEFPPFFPRNAKLKNATNFKPPRIKKCHRFQNAANFGMSLLLLLLSYFFLLLSYFYPSFSYLKSSFFPTFSHSCAGQSGIVYESEVHVNTSSFRSGGIHYIRCLPVGWKVKFNRSCPQFFASFWK